jgi:hypothetical protein
VGIRKSDVSILRPVKRGVFHAFLSLHQPNNSSENIAILNLLLFNSLTKKKFNYKKYMKGICPSFSPRPPHITPMSKSIISNMKQQFVVTHTIRQN